MIPRRVHIIGIGGIGLSAIARVLLARGDQVSGSDQTASLLTDELARLGAKIFIGHRAENLGDVDLVLVTSAASDDNPEIVEAKRRKFRIVKRYDFFAELTAGKKTIAVAGTHGKTTTTGMIATILTNAGLDPDAVIGGVIPELGGNARAGQGEYFVIEADEYDRAFLGLRPEIAVVTSIEMDHPDIFRDVDDVARAFREFMRRVPRDGIVIGCGDSARVSAELRELGTRVARYGFDADNNWRASDVAPNARGGSDFVVWRGATRVGEFTLQIPGRHNTLNALAAIVVASEVGVDLNIARATLKDFRGAARRFQVKGEFCGVTIVDDYAHHPTEIRATLAAARTCFPNRTIWAVFQPHTFSRTIALLDEFADAFADADHIVVTEIYAARERDHRGVSGAQIVEQMKRRDARFIASLDACAQFLGERLDSGDILITLGAGDVNRVGEKIARERGE
ncbi:MAG: UDP-N-acetylmuramate--L-alanine ligase [Anaerolineales bacterium]|nr:UDP-N-acetylmuramate--L-alanine ligase [Anaerolineales bacterium]